MCYQERNQHHACRPVHLLGLLLSRASMVSGVGTWNGRGVVMIPFQDSYFLIGMRRPFWVPLFGDIFLKGKFLYSADVQDGYTCILHRIKYVTLFVGTVLPTQLHLRRFVRAGGGSA